jgi:hypothetical protein
MTDDAAARPDIGCDDHDACEHGPCKQPPIRRERLPEISRLVDPATGDYLWTLRVPVTITTDVQSYEAIRRRVAVWTLRLVATALEELP